VLVATNPWDVFVLTAALAVGTLAAARHRGRGLFRLAVAGAASVVAGLPYIVELVVGIGAGAGGRGLFLTDADFAPAWAVLGHFGQFLVPLLGLAFVLHVSGRAWLMALPLAALAAALGYLMNSSAAALGLASAVVLGVVALRSGSRVPRLMWALAALGMLAVAACERPLQLVALVNLPLGIAQGWLQPRVDSPRPTLDGQAFLAEAAPQTWFLTRGLQGMALPGEVVAEAADLAYAEFTRIAMHTGQPTVVGWPWHLQQRGQSRREIDARYQDLGELYAGADPYARREILDRYRVRWVVLADVERRAYNIAGEEPFAAVPGLVRIASGDGAELFLVREGTAAPSPSVVVGNRELPAEVRPLARVPSVPLAAARAIAIDDRGGTVVLPDGELFELDAVGRPFPSQAVLPCEATGTGGCGDPWSRSKMLPISLPAGISGPGAGAGSGATEAMGGSGSPNDPWPRPPPWARPSLQVTAGRSGPSATGSDDRLACLSTGSGLWPGRAHRCGP
jgi:hypothetical protein